MSEQNQQQQDIQQEMLELARRRELREAKSAEAQEAKEEEATKHYNSKLTARQKADAERAQIAVLKQSKCDHRKGTSHKPKAKHIDYDMSRHTFHNNVTRVKCNKCQMKWFKGDTEKELIRDRKKIPNHTGISYEQAFEMADSENTTNFPSKAVTWIKPMPEDAAV